MSQEVMIVAGEASGDLHGAHLIKSLQKLNPDLSFCGMGGLEISRTGAEILFEASKISVVGSSSNNVSLIVFVKPLEVLSSIE